MPIKGLGEMTIYNYIISAFLLAALSLNACKDTVTDPGTVPPDSLLVKGTVPKWNPVYETIAYYQCEIPEDSTDDVVGIYFIQPDGSTKRLFYQAFIVASLEWSVNGQWLYYSDFNGLYKISYDTGERITVRGPDAYLDLSWAPDGHNLACAKTQGIGRGINLLSADGTDYRLKIPYGYWPDMPFPDSIIYANFDSLLPRTAICFSDTSYSNPRLIYDPGGAFNGELRSIAMHGATGRVIFMGMFGMEQMGLWKIEDYRILQTPTKLIADAKDP